MFSALKKFTVPESLKKEVPLSLYGKVSAGFNTFSKHIFILFASFHDIFMDKR